ncbi:MAG TPA: TOBE domain-containing protein [Gaiellales bacterium]|nr:TOBE domain-containing protein [Gaiellales bacterium]
MEDRLVAIGEAAKSLGVSVDTLRRWERDGRVRSQRDSRNRRMILVSEIERLGGHMPALTGDGFSARNRFEGEVESVEVTGVIAQVVIRAGPHRVVAVVTRDAVEELGLAPGIPAVATVKATSVMVARR